MSKLSDIGEFRVLDRIRSRLPPPSSRVLVGIGDDAAASEPPGSDEALVSAVDLLAEGIDFTGKVPARAVGWKAVAVNLSDLAAMGARPHGILVAIAAPGSTDLAWLDGLYDGIAAICDRFGVDLMGGDLSGVAPGGGITISVTALGAVSRKRIMRRSGARPGDLLCVTGTLGDAAAGLQRMRRAGATGAGHGSPGRAEGPPDPGDPLIARQLEPLPRVAAGVSLAESGVVRAAIDVSDGLVADLGHLGDASGVGARVEVGRIPLSESLRASGLDPWRCALVGGEDFELLFAIRPGDEERARAACDESGTSMTVIGSMTEGEGTTLVRPDGTVLPPPERGGWTHF